MKKESCRTVDKKKVLGVKIPIIKSYKWHAVPLTVLSSCAGNPAWIYNNYLQLAVQEFPENEHWLEFLSLYDLHGTPNFPWLNTQSVDTGLINKFADLKDFLIECINQNYYIDLLYDLYYIEYSFTYMKTHRTSNMLVYGYDLNTQVFYVMDYSYNSKNIYEPIKIDMNTLVNSVLATKGRGIKALYQYDYSYEFRFNPALAIRLIEDYLECRNSMEYIDLTRKYNKRCNGHGLCVYKYFDEFIDMTVKDDIDFSLLPFSSLLEHKICIYKLSEYIKKQYNVLDINKYRAIYELAYSLKNVAIKYSITKNKRLLYEIKKILVNLRLEETDPLRCLQETLNTIH